jgi:imidazolonepropionase-like amidohydrolase
MSPRLTTIDVSTLDVVETRFRNRPDNLDALVGAGLVDTISTDYAGGDWDTIPAALHRMTRMNGISLPQAISLATGNVASVLPEIFGDRGLIAPGKRADIVVTELHNVAKVRHVFIGGKACVLDGQILPSSSRSKISMAV